MLYNPKWEVIYTTKNLADWLSKQPKRKTYNFADSSNCAVAQYLKAHGVKEYQLSVYSLQAKMLGETHSMESLGWRDILNNGKYTFGEAARLARWAAKTDVWHRFWQRVLG